MAETNGSTPKQPRRRVRIRFLATGAPLATLAKDDDPLILATNPVPSWILEMSDGTSLGEFFLWHPMDLASGDTLKLLSIERETAGLPGGAYVTRIREQVQLLVPDLPDDLFERLTSQQLLAIGTKAWQRPGETRQEAAGREADAVNPPVGERG